MSGEQLAAARGIVRNTIRFQAKTLAWAFAHLSLSYVGWHGWRFVTGAGELVRPAFTLLALSHAYWALQDKTLYLRVHFCASALLVAVLVFAAPPSALLNLAIRVAAVAFGLWSILLFLICAGNAFAVRRLWLQGTLGLDEPA